MDPEPSVANTVGAHLIGSFFAICLFGVVLMQIYYYFLTFPDDKWPLKLLVCSLRFKIDNPVAEIYFKVSIIWYTVIHRLFSILF